MAPNISVDNVVIYIADAVRYDYAKDRLSQFATTYKTVSPSHHTPASVSSLLTGKHVPEHGVTGFSKRVPEKIPSIFDIKQADVRFSAKPELQKIIQRNFPKSEKAKLSEMEPPFIWIERSPGGHAPYNQFNYKDYRWGEEGASEYLELLATDTKN